MSKRKRDHVLFLKDVLGGIEKIEKYTKGLTLEDLKDNEMVVDAFVLYLIWGIFINYHLFLLEMDLNDYVDFWRIQKWRH